jgi:hypothetical protein
MAVNGYVLLLDDVVDTNRDYFKYKNRSRDKAHTVYPYKRLKRSLSLSSIPPGGLALNRHPFSRRGEDKKCEHIY